MNQVTHPEYGLLTIHERIGRSRRCTDADGKNYTMSSKVLNKLAGRSEPVQPGPIAPEDFVASVKLYLDSLGDGPVQAMTARDVWAVADSFLSVPKLEAVGT